MNTTSTIYLVRHADYSNPRKIMPGRLPVELSKNGILQAKKLKVFFSDKKIDKIYSSAVLRCKQTSEIISDSKIAIEYNKDLLESFSAYQGYWEIEWSHFFSHTQELGGETNQDIQNRMINFYKKLDLKSKKNYIICSHGDPLYFLYQFLDNQTLLPQDLFVSFDNYQSKGSIRKIEVLKNGNVKIYPRIKNEDI